MAVRLGSLLDRFVSQRLKMQDAAGNGFLRKLDKMTVVGKENDLRFLRQLRHDVERRLRSVVVEIRQGVVDQKRKRLPLADEFFERGEF